MIRITKTEKYAIEAMLLIATRKMDQISELEQEICDILKLEDEDREFGHVSDAIFGKESFKYLKDRLDIEVNNDKEEKEVS